MEDTPMKDALMEDILKEKIFKTITLMIYDQEGMLEFNSYFTPLHI